MEVICLSLVYIALWLGSTFEITFLYDFLQVAQCFLFLTDRSLVANKQGIFSDLNKPFMNNVNQVYATVLLNTLKN